ncbi:hypothetical protein SLS58_009051 [Diplodia intermedia]|uniref:Uncharacterized protein n=1 Tax=Diplodia intermedia TaxID=856260 RepID=A0ABR3TEQ7_9PEZI
MAPNKAIPLSPALDAAALQIDVSGVSLADKNVLITGAASGMGAAIAQAAYITLVDINHALGAAVASQLQHRGLHAQFVAADVTSWPAQVAAFKAALRFHPAHRLDIVVANAGAVGEPLIGGNDNNDADNADTVALDGPDPPQPDTYPWAVNSVGIAFTAKLAQLYFETAAATSTDEHVDHAKSLVLVSSVAAYLDFPGMAAYCGSKFGARGLFRNIRATFAARGIAVNMLAPHIYDTPMCAAFLPVFRHVGLPVSDMGCVS